MSGLIAVAPPSFADIDWVYLVMIFVIVAMIVYHIFHHGR